MAMVKQEQEDMRYKAYISDAAMIISKNLAAITGGEYLNKRWADGFVRPDTRTGDEIAFDVIKNAELRFEDGEE